VQQQDDFSQICTLNFRCVALGAIEVMFSVQSRWHVPGAVRPAASFALIGGSAADFLNKKVLIPRVGS